MEIIVYFSNGRTARFPAGSVVFVRDALQDNERFAPDVTDGRAVINWANVCFVREYHEPEVEDL